MGNNRERRRRLVIDNAVQGRIIMSIAWPPAICLIVTASLLGLFCSRLSEEALLANVELPSVVPVFLTVLAFLGFSTIYILFNALRFSHRVAGPAYRFSKTLAAVREGDFGIRIRLRDGDFLGELADDLNTFLEWLEAHPPEGVEPKTAESDTTPQSSDASSEETAATTTNGIAATTGD